MNRRFFAAFVFCLGAAFPLASLGNASTLDPTATQLIVRLKERQLTAAELDRFSQALAGTERLFALRGSPRTFVVDAETSGRRRRIMSELAKNPAVDVVQPNRRYRAAFAPNDPVYAKQWSFAKVRVPEAWDLDVTAPLYGGDPSIIVAVLDSGFSAGPDFSTLRLATGHDYVNNDTDPKDDNGHGTHVTATLGENTNNGIAAAGIAFESTIMPLKVLGADGQGSTVAITQGINYARENGAKVINLSLGGSDDDPIMHQAIINAKNAGIVVVAAAGNEGTTALSYPAKYSEVIAVGAIRVDETKAAYSNSGEGIDLVAPGGDLSVDQNGDGDPDGVLQQTCTTGACSAFDNYLYVGTSQAAPHVGAAAALMLAAGADATQVQSVLQSTARDLGETGYDTTYGYGLLDIAAAITQVVQDTTPPSGTVTINGGAVTTGSTSVVLTLAATDATGVRTMQLSNDGVTFGVAEPYATQKTWDLADTATGGSGASGVHTVYVQFADAKGNTSAPVSDAITLDLAGPLNPQIRGYTTKAKQRRFVSGVPVTFGLPYFQFSAEDESGVEGYYVSWSTKPSDEPAVVGEYQLERSYTPAKSVGVGTWYFRVRAKDNVGNLSETVTFIFRRRAGYVVNAALNDGSSKVRLLSASGGKPVKALSVFGRGDKRGLSLAQSDLDGDGTIELIAAPTKGKADVQILSPKGKLLKRFLALPSGFRGGLNVAAGDLDGDGQDEIVVVPARGPAQVSVFTGTGQSVRRFFAFPQTYRGGATIAVGDLDGDGLGEIVVATLRKQSLIAVYSGTGEKRQEIKPFGPKERKGISVAVGDVDADGEANIFVAPANGRCQPKILTGSGKLFKKFDGYPESFTGGCRVSAGDVNGDGVDEVILSPASGRGSIRVFRSNGRLLTVFQTQGESGFSTTFIAN